MNRYIPIIACVAAFLITWISGVFVIPFLRKLKFGQTILEEGPSWHKSKQGTPTMGGVMFIIGTVAAVAISLFAAVLLKNTAFMTGTGLSRLFSGLGLAVGMGFIGFIDDYIKVVKKRNLGLTARQKTMLQLLVSGAYLFSLLLSGMKYTWLPFIGEISVVEGVGILFWPVALVFVYGFTNAVNLTDGIDGLCSSVTLVVAAFFMVLSTVFGEIAGTYTVNILSSALAGACVGFLVWNMHPAKVFMGDTGSMYLGGMVVALAFGVGRPVLLLLAGVIYLFEAISVVLQVFFYKLTKKRIFKMAPIHHHFEMSGWSENVVVIVFSAVTLLACVGAYLLATMDLVK